MAKVKRGGTNPINQVEEIDNFDQMRFWMRRGTRSKRRSPFVFKQRCKHMEGKPLLVIGPAGKKIKGSLVRAVRIGSKTIKGWLYREGKNLVIETKDIKSTSDQNKSRRYIYAALGKYKVRVPLKSILFRNPNEKVQKDVKPSSPRERFKKTIKEVQDNPFDEVLEHDEYSESEEEDVDETVLEQEFEEELSQLLEEEDSEEDWWTVEDDDESPEVLNDTIVEKQQALSQTKQQFQALKENLQDKMQRIQDAFTRQGELRENNQRELEEDKALREKIWQADSYDAALEYVQTSHLDPDTKTALQRVESSDLINTLLTALKHRELERNQQEQRMLEKIAQRDQSLDEKVHNQFLRDIELEKQESEIYSTEVSLCGVQGFEDVEAFKYLHIKPILPPLQRLSEALSNSTLDECWKDIREQLHLLQQHQILARLEVSDANKIDHLEAKAREKKEAAHDLTEDLEDLEKDWKSELQSLNNLAQNTKEALQSYRENPNYQDALNEYLRIEETLSQKSDQLFEIKEALIEAHQKKMQSNSRGEFLSSVDDITQSLLTDRRRQSPDAPMYHTDPMDDLRLANPRIHANLREIVEQVPALRLMICYMIYRIQDLENAIAQKLEEGIQFKIADQHDKDGPLADLWNLIPSSSDPSKFSVQYKRWEAKENQYWYLLKNPLETKNR